jgi:predicted nuclease of restriction endonuclease-like (RecB) superfamily
LGHHRYIIDKLREHPEKALFFVRKTVENGWSRSVLLNFLDTDLYERQGKAISNFGQTLPTLQSDLAQEMTKDPYKFDFLTMTTGYKEKELKDALERNIVKFLLELGTGFAFIGREYRIMIGKTEKFIDMLFYNLKLHCYVVIEIKTDKFDSDNIGQLGTYVAAVNHLLRGEIDNPTIGILICKTKDNVLAQYALESSSQPIGISEYELSKLYPADFKGTLPTIEELEQEVGK